MGKKKSKIGKAKQAKAKGNQSSKLGNATLAKNKKKALQSLGFQKQLVQHKLGLEGASGKGMAMSTVKDASIWNRLHTGKVKKVFISHTSSTPSSSSTLFKKATPQQKTTKNDEQMEFQRQMASMQERHAASRKIPQRQKKSELLKEGGAVSTFVQSFQPASFRVDKSTDDILHETMGQMQDMSGVGEGNYPLGINNGGTPTHLTNNQSWTAANEQTKDTNAGSSYSRSGSKNPFEALAEEEDSDNEYAHSASTLQLAPASFMLLPQTTPTPATTPLRESSLDSSPSLVPNISGEIRNAFDQHHHHHQTVDEIDPDL